MNIPPEDHYKQRLMEVKRVAMQWADYAKKVHSIAGINLALFLSLIYNLVLLSILVQVTTDSGALSLDKVYQLITEGENLPVSVEKELKVTNLVLSLLVGIALVF